MQTTPVNLTKRDLALILVALQDLSMDKDRAPNLRRHAEMLQVTMFEAADQIRPQEEVR